MEHETSTQVRATTLKPTTELAATILRIQHADELSALRAIDKAMTFLREDGVFMLGSSFIRIGSRRAPYTVYTTCLNECTCPSWTERHQYWERGEIEFPWCWHLALIRIVWIERAIDLCTTPNPPTDVGDIGDVAVAPVDTSFLKLSPRKYTQADYDECTG